MIHFRKRYIQHKGVSSAHILRAGRPAPTLGFIRYKICVQVMNFAHKKQNATHSPSAPVGASLLARKAEAKNIFPNKKLDTISCRVFYFPIHKEILYRICRGMVALQGVTDALKPQAFAPIATLSASFILSSGVLFSITNG